MKIGVGSKNKTKVGAVEELLKDYPMFQGGEIIPMAVVVEEFGHPKSLEETVQGAVDRAKQAYMGNDYGFGIEGGLMAVPQTKSGFMEVQCVRFMMASRFISDFQKHVSGQQKLLMEF